MTKGVISERTRRIIGWLHFVNVPMSRIAAREGVCYQRVAEINKRYGVRRQRPYVEAAQPLFSREEIKVILTQRASDLKEHLLA